MKNGSTPTVTVKVPAGVHVVDLARALARLGQRLRWISTPEGVCQECGVRLVLEGEGNEGPFKRCRHCGAPLYGRCSRSLEEARDALMAWDGEGEPRGWTRHLPSGRR